MMFFFSLESVPLSQYYCDKNHNNEACVYNIGSMKPFGMIILDSWCKHRNHITIAVFRKRFMATSVNRVSAFR